MYIVDLTYIKPLQEVDRYLAAHIEWLNEHFECKNFIAAGPKNPRTGGIILTATMSKAHLECILSDDPFQKVAKYTITDVNFSRTHADFTALQGSI